MKPGFSGARAHLGTTTMGLLVAITVSLTPSACMLITSPGDFSIVDGSTRPVVKSEAGADSNGACSNINAPLMCATCVQATCCAAYSDCQDDPACLALFNCAPGDNSCESDNMAGQAHADALSKCLDKSCPICSENGVGDPCGTDAGTCAAGLTCTGVFCTKSCVGDSDCAGIYVNGDNSSGEQNRCILDSENAAACFPGCTTLTDCAAFTDATCVPATASISGTTNVCSPSDVTDGGLDGETDAEEDGAPDFDAGFDSGFDAGVDAGKDASTDATVDGTAHPPKDGGSEASGGSGDASSG